MPTKSWEGINDAEDILSFSYLESQTLAPDFQASWGCYRIALCSYNGSAGDEGRNTSRIIQGEIHVGY